MNRRTQLHRTLVLLCLAACFPSRFARPQAKEPPGGVPDIHVNVSRILVPVVVRDRQGRVVTDLKREDFQVVDNNKPHAISGFTVQTRQAMPGGSGAVEVPAAPSPAAPSSGSPERNILFLFDEMHMSAEDLLRARKAATKVLATALSPTDQAAVAALTGRTNSGFTRDQDKLRQAIASLQPQGMLRSTGFDCPRIDYYQADQIENKHDSAARADAVRQVFNCIPGLDIKYNYNTAESMAEAAAQRALRLGYQDTQFTYAALAEFVRLVARLPGQGVIVLVSPGFLPIGQEMRNLESKVIDLAAESNVMISALDARGLYTTELDSSERSPGFSTINGNGGSVQLQSGYRRDSANLAEDSMSELANGTSGRFIHNNNDLDAGFKILAEPPECVYLLELRPEDGISDRSYHRLRVKVDRSDLELQARRGYSLAEPVTGSTPAVASADEVNLDFVVRDKKNRPVLNLKPGDIAVTDDDAPVSINNLRLVKNSDKGEHLVTLLFDGPPPAEDPHQVIDPSLLNHVRQAAGQILKTFPKTGFSFSVLDVQGRLHLQQSFTSDRVAIERAIEAANQPSESDKTQEEQGLMAAARNGISPTGAAVSAGDRAAARMFIAAINNARRIVQDQHLHPSLAALLALAQSQREFAERTAIIYFSSFGDRQPDSQTTKTIQSIISAANRARTTIYAVDFNSVDRIAARMETSALTMNGQPRNDAQGDKSGDSVEAANGILRRLAEGTGGSYIVAEDDISNPAKQLVEDMNDYYEASYLPAIEDYDGKFRAISVHPLRDGITVRSQTGYLALPAVAGATIQEFELPLLKILSQPSLPGDVAFNAAALHMEDMPEGSVYSLAIEVPLSSLDARQDPSTNLYSAHISIVGSIKDASGAVVAHYSEDIPSHMALPGPERANYEAFTLQRHFIAPPGHYVLEAAVLDCNSGKAGARRVPFEIPAASGTPQLSNLVLVRKVEPFSAAVDPSEPMQHGSQKVVPNLAGQLPVGATEFTMFFIANVDPNAPQPPMLGLQILRDGKPLEGAPLVNQEARRAAHSSYLANLFISPPMDGAYEVRATLAQGGKTAEARSQIFLVGVQSPVGNKSAILSPGPGASGSPSVPAPAAPPDPVEEPGSITSTPNRTGAAITLPANPIRPPSPDELAAMLADAARHAVDYGSNLPNFVCEQVTTRSIDAKSSGHWKPKDKFTELLTYVDHQEGRTLLVLERDGSRKHTDDAAQTESGDPEGAISAGEFGNVLTGVFRPQSKTEFKWKETQRLGDGTVQVFDYQVARANSIMNVGVGFSMLVGCHGQVFVDSATHGVRRITMVAEDMPKKSRLLAASVSIDYDYVAINTHEYLMPVSAQILISHDRRETDRNQIEFRNFHRFSSSARILEDVMETKP